MVYVIVEACQRICNRFIPKLPLFRPQNQNRLSETLKRKFEEDLDMEMQNMKRRIIELYDKA